MFNYGVSIDPNYPLFYYNIACVYGGKDDVENAISYLQKAERGTPWRERCAIRRASWRVAQSSALSSLRLVLRPRNNRSN
jgi:hypothetical protein